MTLLRPWDKTLLQGILDLEDWQEVASVHTEAIYVH